MLLKEKLGTDRVNFVPDVSVSGTDWQPATPLGESPSLLRAPVRGGELSGMLEAAFPHGKAATAADADVADTAAALLEAAAERIGRERRLSGEAKQATSEAAAKGLLLRELQHRIKNDLQVITSLTNLQARRCGNPDAVLELEALSNRIEALRLVHDKLYAHAPASVIYLASYVRELCANLLEFCGEALDQPQMQVEIPTGLAVPSDKAIPFGLLLNEFVSQSLKSVLKGGHIAIEVRMEAQSDGHLKLTLNADGHGAPAGIPEAGFGRQLIGLMASQLEGELAWITPASLTLRFLC